MCSSRKYPDPHHGGNLISDPPPPPPRIFHDPPPPRNFHKCDKDPPTPLEKFIFTKKDYLSRRMRPFMVSMQQFPSEACILPFPII